MKAWHHFTRWGGLDCQKQKKEISDNTNWFHYPPADKGFYAFPRGSEYEYLAAHRIEDHHFKRHFLVHKTSLIWHHLGHKLKPHQILNRKGSWVLSHISDWKKAHKKVCHDLKMGEQRSKRRYEKFVEQNKIPTKQAGELEDIPEINKAHLEVFFEDKVETKSIKKKKNKFKDKLPQKYYSYNIKIYEKHGQESDILIKQELGEMKCISYRKMYKIIEKRGREIADELGIDKLYMNRYNVARDENRPELVHFLDYGVYRTRLKEMEDWQKK